MKVSAWLTSAITQLSNSGITTARLDCLILLEDVLGKDRSNILAHDDQILTLQQLSKLDAYVLRRQTHEPIAYIRGYTEFYGREFILTQDVLEPRPESETMIDLLKKIKSSVIADVGTGSGALAITAKLEIPKATVYAIDIDSNCLKVTKQNVKKFEADIHLLKGDLLQPLIAVTSGDLTILANLPYVPNDFGINEAAKHEPALAIYGGVDGLDLYRRMFDQIKTLSSKPKNILTESLPSQHADLSTIAKSHGYTQKRIDDFIQHFTLIP
jgi:release factor glutamine methyltransferase